MTAVFYYGEYVTDDKDENARKGGARKENNYFKAVSKYFALLKKITIFAKTNVKS